MQPERVRLTKRERILWFVLSGLLLAVGGVLLLRAVEAHKPASPSQRAYESTFGTLERGTPGASHIFPEHLPPGAYHLDSAIAWGLVGVGALLVFTGLVWHAVSAKSTVS
jgi:hypothetical protein